MVKLIKEMVLLHLFTDKDSYQINSEQVEQAISIVHWHLLEAKQILEPSIKSPDINNATKLLNWIKSHKLKETSPRHLQQYSPVREKSKRDKAILLLIEHQYVKETTTNNKTLLHINPHG